MWPGRTVVGGFKFVPAVSPGLAARWAGTEIDLGRINLPNSLNTDWVVIEGVGGVLVPINQKQFMLDMMVKFKLPVILAARSRSEEHTSELQSHLNLVCRLLLEKKK